MLEILCEKELKPNSMEYHWKLSVGDIEKNIFSGCYIETTASINECAISINNCLIAVQYQMERLQQQEVE